MLARGHLRTMRACRSVSESAAIICSYARLPASQQPELQAQQFPGSEDSVRGARHRRCVSQQPPAGKQPALSSIVRCISRFGTDRIARIVEVPYTMDETSRRPRGFALCPGTLEELSLRRLYAGPQYEMLINQHAGNRRSSAVVPGGLRGALFCLSRRRRSATCCNSLWSRSTRATEINNVRTKNRSCGCGRYRSGRRPRQCYKENAGSPRIQAPTDVAVSTR